MAMKPDDKVRCSFCGKSSKQVKKMIAGLNNTYMSAWNFVRKSLMKRWAERTPERKFPNFIF